MSRRIGNHAPPARMYRRGVFALLAFAATMCCFASRSDATPCPVSPAEELSSGNSYHYVDCVSPENAMSIHLNPAPEPSGGAYDYALRDLSLTIEGGDYFPSMQLITSTFPASTSWVVENVSIIVRNVRTDKYSGQWVEFDMRGSTSSTTSLRNVHIELDTVAPHVDLDELHGIYVGARDVIGVSLRIVNVALPWHLGARPFLYLYGATSLAEVDVLVRNLTTSSSSDALPPPTIPGMRTLYSNLLTLFGTGDVSSVLIVLTDILLGELEGNGGIFRVTGQHVHNVSVSATNVVLPKNVSERSFVMEATTTMNRIAVTVSGLADAPTGSQPLLINTEQQKVYRNLTMLISAPTVGDASIRVDTISLRRPAHHEASWFAIRGALTNVAVTVAGLAMVNAAFAVPGAGASIESAGGCDGAAMVCMNSQQLSNVSLALIGFRLDSITAATPLVRVNDDGSGAPGITVSAGSNITLADWVLTGSSVFGSGWVGVFPSLASGDVVSASNDSVLSVVLRDIVLPFASGATSRFEGPGVYVGWDPVGSDRRSGTARASRVSGVHVTCRNVTGQITSAPSFIAIYGSQSVSRVSIVWTSCVLAIISIGCLRCDSLGGRGTHVAIGHTVLQSVAVEVIASSLTGDTLGYQENGYTLSIVCLHGPLVVASPVATWRDIRITATSSYVYLAGPASSVINVWFVKEVVGMSVEVNGLTMELWATSGYYGPSDSGPRCSLILVQPLMTSANITVRTVTATFFVFGGQPDNRVASNITYSVASQLVVIGGVSSGAVLVTGVVLRSTIVNGTLTPPTIVFYPDAAANQVTVAVLVLDPRHLSRDASFTITGSSIDSVVIARARPAAVRGSLAICTSIIVAGNCTSCVFSVDNCTVISNASSIASPLLLQPRIVSLVFFQPMGKLLTQSFDAGVLPLMPNLEGFMSTRHVNCTVVVSNTMLTDLSPPTSIVLAAFVLPADDSVGYNITARACVATPVLRGAMQLYDYPLFVGGACFAGCVLQDAYIVLDGLTGLMPAAWALTGGSMIMPGTATLRVINNVIACAYTVPNTIRSAFSHETNCSIVRFMSRGISKGQPGSLHLSDTSFIEVSRNRFVDEGYSSAVLSSDDNGVVSRGAVAFTSVDATWRMGCNVVGPRRAPLPGRLTPLEYFTGMDAAQLVFPPDAGLPGSYVGVVCRAPSGGETATATRYEPPGPWTRPVVQAVIASTTTQTWALVAAGVLGPASSASGASMSRVQGAFVVLALRDRCRSYELSVSEGGEPAPDDTVVFGTNSVDNPLGIDMSAVVEGGAGVTVGTLVGNTLLVVICALVALLTTTVIKPPLLRYMKALEARRPAAVPSCATGAKVKRHCGRNRIVCYSFKEMCEALHLGASLVAANVVHTLPSDPFPASIYTFYTLLLQPSVTAALLLVAFSNSGGGQAGSAIGIIFALLWAAPALWFTYVVALRVRPLPLSTKRLSTKSKKSHRFQRTFNWVFRPGEMWMPPASTKKKGLPQQGGDVFSMKAFRLEYARLLFDRYMCVFDVYRQRRHYFFAIEIAGAVFLGVVGAAALGVPPESACDAAVWGSWLVIGCSCALLLAVAALRPHTVRFDLIVLVSGTVLCVGSEVASMTEDDEAGGVLLIVTAWTQIVFLVLNLAAEWMEGDGDHRRRLAELQDDALLSHHSFDSNSAGASAASRDGGAARRQSMSSPSLRVAAPVFLPKGAMDVMCRSVPEVFLQLAIREVCHQKAIEAQMRAR